MAAKAKSSASIRRFDLTDELRSTADRRKRPADRVEAPTVPVQSREGIPDIAQRLAAKFPDLGVDVVHAVLSEIFRASPNCSRQQLASCATAKLLEMSLVHGGPQSVTSFEPAHLQNDNMATGSEPSEDCGAKGTLIALTEDSDITRLDRVPCSTDELTDELDLDEQLASLLTLDDSELKVCVKTMLSVLRRIEERPDDERVRRLRQSNSRFKTEVARHEAALELLRIAGFAESGVEEDATFIFNGDPKASQDFARVRECLEGILEIWEDPPTHAGNVPTAVVAPSASSTQVDANDHRRCVAELTEQRLRDPRRFREDAKKKGAANRASGQGFALRVPAAVANRRAQHFTLADVERMRISDEIANTPCYAEEYRLANHNQPVHDYSSLVLRSYDPQLIARQAMDLTNQYRASKGLPPCVWNDGIARIAAEHAAQMASGKATFSHDGFDERVKAFPVAHRSAAENLAFNKGMANVASVAVEGWIKSPGHEKNLRGAFNMCGIGVAQASDGAFYITQLFAHAC
jgi:uncharacterized protein YkwD